MPKIEGARLRGLFSSQVEAVQEIAAYMKMVVEQDALIIASAHAEIERLRAALKNIAAIEDQMEGPDWEEIEQARQIAAEALMSK